MARSKDPTVRALPDPVKRFQWYTQTNAHASDVGDWDLKSQQFTDAVLTLLAGDLAVMFGRTRDGGAISVTIFDGPERTRVYLDDAIAMDDWADLILAGAKAAGVGRWSKDVGTEAGTRLPAD